MSSMYFRIDSRYAESANSGRGAGIKGAGLTDWVKVLTLRAKVLLPRYSAVIA